MRLQISHMTTRRIINRRHHTIITQCTIRRSFLNNITTTHIRLRRIRNPSRNRRLHTRSHKQQPTRRSLSPAHLPTNLLRRFTTHKLSSTLILTTKRIASRTHKRLSHPHTSQRTRLLSRRRLNNQHLNSSSRNALQVSTLSVLPHTPPTRPRPTTIRGRFNFNRHLPLPTPEQQFTNAKGFNTPNTSRPPALAT